MSFSSAQALLDDDASSVLSTAASRAAGDVCRICWEPDEGEEPGGRVALHCQCTMGLHDRCLMRWLLSDSGRAEPHRCELCTGLLQGALTVSVADLAQAAAAYKASAVAAARGPGGSELQAVMGQLQERTALLSQVMAQAEANEAARQLEWEQMKRVAARDRQALLDGLEAERRWRRSNWRWVPAVLLAAAGAFLAGAQWEAAQRPPPLRA